MTTNRDQKRNPTQHYVPACTTGDPRISISENTDSEGTYECSVIGAINVQIDFAQSGSPEGQCAKESRNYELLIPEPLVIAQRRAEHENRYQWDQRGKGEWL